MYWYGYVQMECYSWRKRQNGSVEDTRECFKDLIFELNLKWSATNILHWLDNLWMRKSIRNLVLIIIWTSLNWTTNNLKIKVTNCKTEIRKDEIPITTSVKLGKLTCSKRPKRTNIISRRKRWVTKSSSKLRETRWLSINSLSMNRIHSRWPSSCRQIRPVSL